MDRKRQCIYCRFCFFYLCVLFLGEFLHLALYVSRTALAAGALRVSLSDIHSVETKGKWWLVGASWAGRDDETREKEMAERKAWEAAEKAAAKANEDLLRLARAQRMNTDVRRAVFVAIMSAEDYADALEKLGKLGLSDVQEREIVRVLLHCCGAYSLWDFMRQLGEQDVGALESALNGTSASTEPVPLRRSLNLARLYAALVAEGDLGLVVLKTLPFERLGTPARLFLQCFFATLFAACGEISPEGSAANSVSKRHRDPAEAAVASVFSRCAAAHAITAQGCLLFLHMHVRSGNEFLKTDEECKRAKRLVAVAKEAVKRAEAETHG
ncbi:MAG: hypothetical protein BJ554DRAFT_5677, partial [Olpidium bornovanus]